MKDYNIVQGVMRTTCMHMSTKDQAALFFNGSWDEANFVVIGLPYQGAFSTRHGSPGWTADLEVLQPSSEEEEELHLGKGFTHTRTTTWNWKCGVMSRLICSLVLVSGTRRNCLLPLRLIVFQLRPLSSATVLS